MRPHVLTEPPLEFADDFRHVDPRYGVTEYGPADLGSPSSRTIRVGLIGHQGDIAEAAAWLTSCEQEIAGKKEDRPGLWPAWPGFTADAGYRATLELDDRLQRPLRQRDLENLAGLPPAARVQRAVDLYLDELRAMAEDGRPDVVICVLADAIVDMEDEFAVAHHDAQRSPNRRDDDSAGRPAAFHDLLKAYAMPIRVPLQLVRPSTFNSARARAQRRKSWRPREREDDATVAWNFFTALYYKAGGTPWRMTRDVTDFDTCFVGIKFFHTHDRRSTGTSVAQVFNQRGDGVVVRGGPAQRSTQDKQLHLTEESAYGALRDALRAYRQEHRHAPARLTIHKTTPFDEAERHGIERALDEAQIEMFDLVWITGSPIRLHRDGERPPLRGTMLEVASDYALLYTRGSVEWYEGYAGLRVPRPVCLRPTYTDRALRELANDVLALSKMNWNSTRSDSRLPVNIRTADEVAKVIKHLPDNAPIEARYAYYM